MNTEEKKKKILEFVKRCEFGVVSTIALGSSTPESAVVAVSETDNLELVFASFAGNRKNNNIATNPSVSVVLGWSKQEKITVQVEGVATLVADRERTLLEQKHCAKNPESLKFVNDPRQQYFKITPVWVRYSDFRLILKKYGSYTFDSPHTYCNADTH